MTFLSIFYWTGACIAIILQLFNHHYLSKGEVAKVYVLTSICSVIYIMIETTLALTAPDQLGILLFNIVNVWSLISAIKGMYRIKQLSKTDMA